MFCFSVKGDRKERNRAQCKVQQSDREPSSLSKPQQYSETASHHYQAVTSVSEDVGAVTSLHVGAVTSLHVGAVTSLHVGAVASLHVGAVASLHVGAVASLHVGAVASLHGDAVTSPHMGAVASLLSSDSLQTPLETFSQHVEDTIRFGTVGSSIMP